MRLPVGAARPSRSDGDDALAQQLRRPSLRADGFIGSLSDYRRSMREESGGFVPSRDHHRPINH